MNFKWTEAIVQICFVTDFDTLLTLKKVPQLNITQNK